MKYETRNIIDADRWGHMQAEAKRQYFEEITGIDTHSRGDVVAIQDPNHLTFGWVNTTHTDFAQADVSAQVHPSQKVLAEFEVLRDSLNHCLVCGERDVFLFCSLCRQAVKEARAKYIDEALESMRP